MAVWFDEGILAFGRYLSWADLNRSRWNEDIPEDESMRYVAFASHWYASLQIAVEGFGELGLRDNLVESILASPTGHANMLRRCRNGVYHFEPEFIEKRYLELVSDFRSTSRWVEALRAELIRVFWSYPETVFSERHEVNEWRDAMYTVLNWLPRDTTYMRILLIEREIHLDDECMPGGLPESAPPWKRAEMTFDDEQEARFTARMIEEIANGLDRSTVLAQLRQSALDLRSQLLKEQQRYFDAGWLSRPVG